MRGSNVFGWGVVAFLAVMCVVAVAEDFIEFAELCGDNSGSVVSNYDGFVYYESDDIYIKSIEAVTPLWKRVDEVTVQNGGTPTHVYTYELEKDFRDPDMTFEYFAYLEEKGFKKLGGGVRVLPFKEDGEYFVIEFVGGTTMEQRIATSVWTEEDIAAYQNNNNYFHGR